jgi:outer membrane immunogenic protein
MRNCLVGLAAALSLAAVDAARAGDDWTGFHIGAHAGYGQHRGSTSAVGRNEVGQVMVEPISVPLAKFVGLPANSLALRGLSGGAQAGYDWQLSDRWLVGLETDLGSGWQGSQRIGFHSLAGDTALDVASRIDWFGTLRGRIGILPAAGWMAFVTGGLAYGRVSESASSDGVRDTGYFGREGSREICLPGETPCIAGSAARIRAGWSAGAGIEHALGPHLVLRVEYLHVDLGAGTIRLTGRHPAGGLPASADVETGRTDVDLVRAAVNWRF